MNFTIIGLNYTSCLCPLHGSFVPQNKSTEYIQMKDTNSSRDQRLSTWLAFALLPLAGFATDIYLPSLPDMSASLNISEIQIQLTLSIFLISYGLSQLFIGSVLDSFGRHKIGIVCLLVFALASFVIGSSHNIYVIYLMRVVHAITAATIVVAKRAYFVDVFTGNKLKHYLSLFSIIWSVGPIVAPFVGGYLQSNFGWASNFYFLGIWAIVFAVLEYFFNTESLKNFSPFHLKSIVNIYLTMLRTTSFTLGLLVIGISYAMVMVYNMTGPFIIEHHLHFTPVIAGYCSLIIGFAWMIGGFIGKATIHKPFVKKLSLNLGAQVMICLVMLFSSSFVENIFLLVCFAFLVHISAGFAFNVYFTYCLGKFPNNAGIASGLTGGVMYVIVSVLSYGMVYFIPANDTRHLGWSYLFLIAASALVMRAVTRNSKSAVRSQPH